MEKNRFHGNVSPGIRKFRFFRAEEGFAAKRRAGVVKNEGDEHRVQLGEILNTVYALVQPLSRKMQVALFVEVEADVADFLAAALAVRKILITILSTLIPQIKSGR